MLTIVEWTRFAARTSSVAGQPRFESLRIAVLVTWHTLLEFLPGLYIGPASGGVEYSSDPEEGEDEDCWESDDDCGEGDEGHKRVKSSIDEQLMATLMVATVADRSDDRPTWAYRFIESGTTLAALEFGDEVSSVVWMRQELPEDTQLMLAAAMTAILQGQSTTPR